MEGQTEADGTFGLKPSSLRLSGAVRRLPRHRALKPGMPAEGEHMASSVPASGPDHMVFQADVPEQLPGL
jgi:hypothetical protein